MPNRHHRTSSAAIARRESVDSFVSASNHNRTPSSTSSIFSLASGINFSTPTSKSNQRHSFFGKILQTAKSHQNHRDDEDLEWRCKGDDFENFNWPPAGWAHRSDTPPLSPPLSPPSNHSRVVSSASSSSTSTQSSSSATSLDTEFDDLMGQKVQIVTSEDIGDKIGLALTVQENEESICRPSRRPLPTPYNPVPIQPLNVSKDSSRTISYSSHLIEVDEAENRRRNEEMAAIAALDAFFARHSVQNCPPTIPTIPASVLPERTHSLGIDLSAYDPSPPLRSSTFTPLSDDGSSSSADEDPDKTILPAQFKVSMYLPSSFEGLTRAVNWDLEENPRASLPSPVTRSSIDPPVKLRPISFNVSSATDFGGRNGAQLIPLDNERVRQLQKFTGSERTYGWL